MGPRKYPRYYNYFVYTCSSLRQRIFVMQHVIIPNQFSMLLARLRTFTPRLAFRGILSKPPPIILGQKTTERDDSYKPRSAKDFLDVLSMEPLPPGSTPLGSRNLEDENEILTRQLRSTLKDQTYHIYVKSTNNNTIISLTDPEGNKLKGGSASGGLVGFKGVHRSGMSTPTLIPS